MRRCSGIISCELANAIVDTVRHALALNLQSFNDAGLVKLRLPSEIWSNVWFHLNAHDRLTVTQVSHSWRHIASRCPQLWNDVSMATSRHKAGCSCEVCYRPHDNEVHETHGLCKWCLRRPRHLKSNVLLAQHHISRTGSLPLSLRLNIVGGSRVDTDAMQEMSTALEPHVDRLQHLNVRTDNPDAVYQHIISRFVTLPNLVSLVLDRIAAQTIAWDQQLTLSRLERLKITGSAYPGGTFSSLGIFAPNVRAIFCEIYDLSDVAYIFGACPIVEDVTFTFSNLLGRALGGSLNTPVRFQEFDKEIIARFISSGKLSHLRIVGVDEWHCTAIIDAFQSTNATVTVEFDGLATLDNLTPLITNIEDATELYLGFLDSDRFTWMLAQGANRWRQARTGDMYGAGDITMFALDIWTVICKPLMLRSITVTSTLINDLFHEAPDLCFTNLEIQFGHPDHCQSLTQWLDPTSAVVHRTGAFTVLENLTIKATHQQNWRFDMSESEIIGSITTRLGLHARKGAVKLTTEGLLINTGAGNWPVWEELAVDPIIL